MRQVLFTKEEIVEACNSSPTMSQAAKKLDLPFKLLRRVAKQYGCFKPNRGGKGVKGERGGSPKMSLQDIFNGKHPSYGANKLRQRLISEGFKPHTCEKCGLSEWLGQPIPIELHHIDGNPHNHSLNNLQILCNNCHTLTDNYRGKGRTIPLIEDDIIKMIPMSYTASDCVRKLGKRPQKHYLSKVHKLKEQYNLSFLKKQLTIKEPIPNFTFKDLPIQIREHDKLCACGKIINTNSTRCKECYDKLRQTKIWNCKICGEKLCNKSISGLCITCYNSNRETKIIWPSKEELEKMIWEMPTILLAQKLNVSDSAITKHCKALNIEKPPRGYWAKVYHNKL